MIPKISTEGKENNERNSTVRKNIQWARYMIALVITIFIFIMGLYVGGYSTNLKFESLYDLQNKIRSETMGTELQYLIAGDDPCTLVNMDLFTEEINKIGSRLTDMESQLGVDNKGVVSLKEYYHLLEIRHFLFMKKALQECKKKYGLVLYFYSNAGDCSDCKEQGYVLSYVNKKYPVFGTYSFDINIDNPAIRTLKRYYNITAVPSIVVNDRTYTGFQARDDLYREILGKDIPGRAEAKA